MGCARCANSGRPRGPTSAQEVYVNYLSEGEGEERIRGAYGVNYGRLVKLKKKYDPTNFFHINQNIGASKVAA